MKLAERAILTLDETLVAVSIRAEAFAKVAAAEAAAAEVPAPTPGWAPTNPVTSVVPRAPTASYVAGRVGGGARPLAFAGNRSVRSASNMAPRPIARNSGGLPPVIVKMDGGKANVQNAAEVAAARAAIAEQRQQRSAAPPVTSQLPDDLSALAHDGAGTDQG